MKRKFDCIALQEMNLTLGKHIYIKKFTLPEEFQNNKKIFENDKYSLSGIRMLKDIEISSNGNVIIL